MIYHQSNVFLQDRLNSFHRVLNISNFHPRVSQQFMVVFSRRHAQHFKTEEEFSSQSCSILFKIRGSSSRPSSHNCFRL